MLVGAVGTAGLFLRASQHTPRLLLLTMAVWVFSPFAALVWADAVSKRWSALTRTTLHGVMLFVALASLAIYGADAVWPRKSQPAFFYVLVPAVSWLLSAIVVAIAASISRKQSRRANGL